MQLSDCVCVCVLMCVCERERERSSTKGLHKIWLSHIRSQVFYANCGRKRGQAKRLASLPARHADADVDADVDAVRVVK